MDNYDETDNMKVIRVVEAQGGQVRPVKHTSIGESHSAKWFIKLNH